MTDKKTGWITVNTYDSSYIDMAQNFQDVLRDFGIVVDIVVDDDMLRIELEEI